jgi:hypothetical protein
VEIKDAFRKIKILIALNLKWIGFVGIDMKASWNVD